MDDETLNTLLCLTRLDALLVQIQDVLQSDLWQHDQIPQIEQLVEKMDAVMPDSVKRSRSTAAQDNALCE